MLVLVELLKRRPLGTLVRMFALGLIIAAVVKAVSGGIDPVALVAVTVVVEAAFLVGIVGGITALIHLVVRRRRTKERRHLARLNGWRCDARAADLPAALGDREHRLVNAHGHVFCQVEPVPAGARAHAVVRGEVKGIAFTAFDYFLPGVFPVEVTTAWLVRLPHALPRFVSAEVFWSATGDASPTDGTEAGRSGVGAGAGAGEDLATRADPAYVRDVVTDELVAFTRERLPSWWVDGHVLAATTHSTYQTHRQLGLSARQLGLGIEAMTWLARHLGSPTVAAHAT
jgi:hypothetical protein